MRLGQLSRKLSLRPAEIVTFLVNHGVSIENSVNTRLDPAHLELVLMHYAPHLAASGVREEEVSDRMSDDVTEALTPPEEPEVEKETSDIEARSAAEPTDEPDEMQLNEVDGVIKAPRVELQGLKILGKIELPGPKKNAAETPSAEVSDEEQGQNTVSPPANEIPVKKKREDRNRRPQDKRGRRNPIAAERERLARQQEEQQKKESETLKERKRQHYYKRVTPKGPTKAARIHDEETAVILPDQPEPPKTLWGKFLRWLTN